MLDSFLIIVIIVIFVIAVFLFDNNIEQIRKAIFTRGLWDEAKKYSDKIKTKEVDRVVAFNKYIIKEAKRFSLPIVDMSDRKVGLQSILKTVKL